MGFVWSLQSVPLPGKHKVGFAKRDLPNPEHMTIAVLAGLVTIQSPDDVIQRHVICAGCHKREYIGPGVRRVVVREGRIRGVLYLPPGNTSETPSLPYIPNMTV